LVQVGLVVLVTLMELMVVRQALVQFWLRVAAVVVVVQLELALVLVVPEQILVELLMKSLLVLLVGLVLAHRQDLVAVQVGQELELLIKLV
jgi:hypothetical protein